MPAHSRWHSRPPRSIRRFLVDNDSRLGGLLRAVAGREAPAVTAAGRLVAIAFAVMLVTMVAAAFLLPGTSMAGWPDRHRGGSSGAGPGSGTWTVPVRTLRRAG